VIYLIKVNTAHLDPQRTISQYIHCYGKDDLFLGKHGQLRHQILLLVIVEQQILRFGNDRHQLLEVDEFALNLVLDVDVH